MLFVSFAWCPILRKLQLQPGKLEQTNQTKLHGPERITAISSFSKLILIPVVAAIYAWTFELNVKFKGISAGFLKLGNIEYLSLLLINISCGLISQFLAKLGCKLGLKSACFLLPVITSTILSILLVGAFDGCKFLHICRCGTHVPSDEFTETTVLGVLMCLAQICSTIIYVWQSQEFITAKDSMLFWVPSYDGRLLTFQIFT